jgi:U4/U6.U5 tri-snRNP-associated protein 1
MDNQCEEEIKESSDAKSKKSATKSKNYTSQDLVGLSIEHSQEVFKEGQETILTLKDKNVLDEENDDALVNVNIIDEEKAKKNIENLKQKPKYKPYDDFDENGIVSLLKRNVV